MNELFRTVEESDDVALVLSRDLRQVRTNGGWHRFAAANGGDAVLERWTPGTSILSAIPPVLPPFYVAGYERAFATGERWEHDYECSSAERFRQFRMVVYPARPSFLVVVHSLRVERPHDRAPSAPDLERYTVEGVVTMCSHCRRVRFPAGTARWDWIPELVSAPPAGISHGLCGPCIRFYYPDYA